MSRPRSVYLVLTINLIEIVASQNVCKVKDNDPCRCDLVSGDGVVDMSFGNPDSPLFKDVPGSDTSTTYSYNPCHPFSSDDNTVQGLAVMLAISTGVRLNDDITYYDLGQQASATFQIDSDNDLSILYNSSDTVTQSALKLKCDKSSDNDLTAMGPDQDYVYQFTLSGRDVCPGSGGGSSGSGLSGGSILLIISTVLLFVYFVCGMLYNKKRKDASGTDMIPNKEFWTSLPGLIKDGFMFFVYKCKGRPNASLSYDNI